MFVDAELVSSWFPGAVRLPWSPRGCLRYPTTCARKLQTDCARPEMPGGSGSATDTHTSTASQWGTLIRLKCYFNSLGLFICACKQPDGAESVDSLHSSDGVPEKKAAGRQRANSGTPTISVSRASVSSGTSITTYTSCLKLHSSHIHLTQFQDVLAAAVSYQMRC